MSSRVTNDHPDDIMARWALVQYHKTVREGYGVSLDDVGAQLGLSRKVAWSLERPKRGRIPNPRISTIQRNVRAIGELAGEPLLAVIELTGIVEPDPELDDRYDTIELAHHQAMTNSTDPAVADEAERNIALMRLRIGRRRRGASFQAAGNAMGIRESSLHRIEGRGDDPTWATYQRYARWLGGRCDINIVVL